MKGIAMPMDTRDSTPNGGTSAQSKAPLPPAQAQQEKEHVKPRRVSPEEAQVLPTDPDPDDPVSP
jgi:hypothetical protein